MLRGRWMAWKATSWSRVSIPRWSWGTSGWSWCVPMFSIRSEFFPQLSHPFILFHIVSPCYTAWLELSEGLKERARSGRFGWPREMESQQVTIDMGGEKTVRVNADLFSLAGDNKYAAMLSDRWQGKGGLKDDCSMFVDYSPKVFMPLIDSHAAIAVIVFFPWDPAGCGNSALLNVKRQCQI